MSEIVLKRFLREYQKPELLMEYHDHNNKVKCYCCSGIETAYYLIPLLGNITVCKTCHRKWDMWAFPMFKEMIHFE